MNHPEASDTPFGFRQIDFNNVADVEPVEEFRIEREVEPSKS